MTKKEEIQARRQEILRLLQNSDREHPMISSKLPDRHRHMRHRAEVHKAYLTNRSFSLRFVF